MTFPAYEDIEEPLLCYIFFHGGANYEIKASDSYLPLAKYFGLNQSERNEVLSDNTGRSRWNNMVQWARRKLNDRNYLATSVRGVWKLSDTGILKAQRVQQNYLQLK